MEAMEELSGSNIDHHTLIVKGKRTKRPRPSSPFAMAVTSSSSSGGGGEDVYFSSILSPTSSDEFSTSTQEDEDMANCLILLAQGVGVGPRQADGGCAEKPSSRRFAEMATTTAGKAGIFVYECKTCNRSFPSFQALGGHRASHKKPKADEIKKAAAAPVQEDDKEEGGQLVTPLTLPLLAGTRASHGSKRPKVHECSICGSEFSSGQALGGHMRRHRTPTNASVSMTFHTTTGDWAVDDKPRPVLTLDLNLPAPEDDGREAKFPFGPSQLFSTPALVDCHY